ncbi:MAG: YkgJ family cysteine cluster protein [Bryobacterales bacterium]|nr:YkgJ family cysteine cluster protein [Bryobacterales bacterium]
MDCRAGCGACCIVPGISSLGKPAFVRCEHLTAENRCALFGRPERPAVCASLRPSPEMCGESAEEATAILTRLEFATRPVLSKRH